MFQGGKPARSWLFLLKIPTRPSFNYSPSGLSVRLQVWPGAERPLHPITQFDLLTFHLFSNHDMTFRVCQVRAIPARASCSSLPPSPSKGPPPAPHCINHSDIVIAAVFPSLHYANFWANFFDLQCFPPLHPAHLRFPRHSPIILDLRAHSHGNSVLFGHCFVGESSGPILGF